MKILALDSSGLVAGVAEFELKIRFFQYIL